VGGRRFGVHANRRGYFYRLGYWGEGSSYSYVSNRFGDWTRTETEGKDGYGPSIVKHPQQLHVNSNGERRARECAREEIPVEPPGQCERFKSGCNCCLGDGEHQLQSGWSGMRV
jgi:hypothetical protein